MLPASTLALERGGEFVRPRTERLRLTAVPSRAFSLSERAAGFQDDVLFNEPANSPQTSLFVWWLEKTGVNSRSARFSSRDLAPVLQPGRWEE